MGCGLEGISDCALESIIGCGHGDINKRRLEDSIGSPLQGIIGCGCEGMH